MKKGGKELEKATTTKTALKFYSKTVVREVGDLGAPAGPKKGSPEIKNGKDGQEMEILEGPEAEIS